MADQLMERVDGLCRREFCVGNIAPDCNVENEDWTSFTPPREVTHWMGGPRKEPGDCERFYREYVEKRREEAVTLQEYSFLLGYYVHLLADGLFQQMVWDSEAGAGCVEQVMRLPRTKQAGSGDAGDLGFRKAASPQRGEGKGHRRPGAGVSGRESWLRLFHGDYGSALFPGLYQLSAKRGHCP